MSPSRCPNPQRTKTRNQRISRHSFLVDPIAHFYASHSPEPFDDLRQVGLIGLLRAAELYQPKRLVPFEAFARPHIRGAILHYLRDGAPSIRLPRTLVELRQRDPASLTANQQERLAQVAGLHRPLSLDCNPELGEALIQQASQGVEPDPGESPSGPSDIGHLLALLAPQERVVVNQVVLAGWSYRQTAKRLGISPMTVQRRLKRGLAILRESLVERSTSPRAGWRPVPFAAPGC